MWIMLDVEATGPAPGLYSMFWFGAVVVKPGLEHNFEGRMRPLPGAEYENGPEENPGLSLSQVTAEEVSRWPQPADTIREFVAWLNEMKRLFKDDRLMLISDNNGYDAMWITYYMARFHEGKNPFGHSSTNLGSLYKGLVKDMFSSFKGLRVTPHSHNPVDDAMGNAEALLYMRDRMGLTIKL